MNQNFSIDEILLAVNEIQSRQKRKKNKILKSKSEQKDYSKVPKGTLKIIEEAENIK